MRTLEQLRFDNRYARLPQVFYDRVTPLPLRDAHLIHFNGDAASLIELDPDQAGRPDFVDHFNGVCPLPGSEPLAMCYSGHQFGVYVPRLGDGRAILMGQVRSGGGDSWDLQVKGGGPTLYSRNGDGRAVLRSSIREYLCSEAMHGLGIPTTRALCLIGSREGVYRERLEPGALVVRMAQSHVRFGSFEYFYHTDQHDHLRLLADHVIEEHYPQLQDHPEKYAALFEEVTARTAALTAQWLRVGFAHGVMNSDNMSILGLTIDYGPFGFLDTYEAGHICNHSDYDGRYAFDQQPSIGLFNLSCLAQALLPLFADDKTEALAVAKRGLSSYWGCFKRERSAVVAAKLGLYEAGEEDVKLWQRLLALMEGRVDFTRLFRALSGFDRARPRGNDALRDMFLEREAFDDWAESYAARLDADNRDDDERRESMNRANPKYVLRNYLAEQAIRRAEDEGDYSGVERLIELLRNPYDEQPEMEAYAALPPDWAQKIEVSCSS